MSITTRASTAEVSISRGDVRTIQRSRTWKQFEGLQQGFENSRGVRLFYYNGIVEILMPGIEHELFKTVIGMLLETFLLDRDIEFMPTGSMTQQIEGVAAAEADESYQIDGYRLCVEVNFTSGDASKLECYRLLAVDEVWLWEDGLLTCYSLKADGYQRSAVSKIPALKAIDFSLLTRCILLGETSRVEAVKQFRAAQ
jgi:hypothetical protein